MDPATIATTAVTVLSPYLAKAGEKAVEEVGKTLPGMAGKVWQAIVTKFTGQPAAEEAVKDLVKQPADDDNKASFRKELRKVVESDAPFARQLEELLRQAQHEAGTVIHNTGSGAVATSGRGGSRCWWGGGRGKYHREHHARCSRAPGMMTYGRGYHGRNCPLTLATGCSGGATEPRRPGAYRTEWYGCRCHQRQRGGG